MTQITRILSAMEQGNGQATNELLPLVYDELRRLATQRLSTEKPGQTLQATALVHEAYVRLVGSEEQNWDGRGHFFAAAAEAMRRIIIENARRKQRIKRGRDQHRVDLKEDLLLIGPPAEDLLALDEALEQLATEDRQSAEVVKLKYFAGFTTQQAAEVLGISVRTAYRDWEYARTWLRLKVSDGDEKRTE